MVNCLQTKNTAIMISLIQDYEADFLWKVSLKILNSGIVLKTFTHVYKNLLLIKMTSKYSWVTVEYRYFYNP